MYNKYTQLHIVMFNLQQRTVKSVQQIKLNTVPPFIFGIIDFIFRMIHGLSENELRILS